MQKYPITAISPKEIAHRRNSKGIEKIVRLNQGNCYRRIGIITKLGTK
jgi:hypothetical protein